jgi:dienelactone hydrolase
MKKHILFITLLLNYSLIKSQTTITFLAKDSVVVTADLYFVSDSLPYVVLCHQAGYSRGEYRETAWKFMKLGFNCVAVDARSGKEVKGVENETAISAKEKGKPTTYLDAEKDIQAAINYSYKKSGKLVLLVGSSYSASLAMKIGVKNRKVRAVIAFSPGEYFGDKLNLKSTISSFNKPLFVTSARSESADVSTLISDIKQSTVVQFIPKEEGIHGASALWKTTPNYNEYWREVILFVCKLYKGNSVSCK